MIAHAALGVQTTFRKLPALLLLATLISVAATGTAPGQGNDKLAAVPDADSQAKAEKLVRELFADEYAKKAIADKLALSAKLVEQAKETKDDQAAKFVLYREARDIAAKAGDAVAAIKAVDELAKEFAVNGPALKAEALEVVVTVATSPPAAKGLVEIILPLTDEPLAQDDFDGARRLLKLATAAAKNAKSVPLVTSVQARSKEVDSLAKDFEVVQKAAETLANNANDANANLTVGRFACFMKGNWLVGLPMLAQCSDAKLKAVAIKDLAPPKTAAERVEAGDGWWDLAEAEKGRGKPQIQGRAHYWYSLALPDLSGLTKTKVEKRLAVLPRPPTAGGTKVADLPKEITNSIGMKLALIPAGKFTMLYAGPLTAEEKQGFPPTANRRPDTKEVAFAQPFYVGVHEVTQKQFQDVMGNNPSKQAGKTDRPVDHVTFEEAVEFCQKLSAIAAEKEAGRVYRLPTEAEWEYAYRAGSKTPHYFDLRQVGEYAWTKTTASGSTHPVGQLKPNAWGLYDMNGNVWEWCSDAHGADRALRGSSLFNSVDLLRTRSDPARRTFDFGFRVVCTVR